MKPHLQKLDSLWYCWVARPSVIFGVGYTPKQAYDDWLLLALGVK